MPPPFCPLTLTPITHCLRALFPLVLSSLSAFGLCENENGLPLLRRPLRANSARSATLSGVRATTRLNEIVIQEPPLMPSEGAQSYDVYILGEGGSGKAIKVRTDFYMCLVIRRVGEF